MSQGILTPKQGRFLELYLKTGNAAQSYAEAYGTKNPDTARINASRLLTNANIEAAIKAAHKAGLNKLNITVEEVLAEIHASATYDATEIFTITEVEIPSREDGEPPQIEQRVKVKNTAEWPEKIRKAVVGIEQDRFGCIRVKFSDKDKSREMLGRHLAMFTDNVNNNNKDVTPPPDWSKLSTKELLELQKLQRKLAGE